MIVLRKIELEEFEDKCLDMYLTLFPKKERRKLDNITKSYLDGVEIFYIIELDKKLIGFIALEHLNNHPYYLEYFAIAKEYHGKGYGTLALKQLIDLIGSEGIVAEIEDINSNEISKKRLEFYERAGFTLVGYLYDLFNVLYNPIVYNYSGDITNALFDYYICNMGKDRCDKNCRVLS